MSYFPDARFFDQTGRLFPHDVRFDPADRACCDPLADGTVRLRVSAEPGFTAANVVFADGTGMPMERWWAGGRFDHWQAIVTPPSRRFEYTFAFRDANGEPVYLVPAGISNAVERIDRFVLDLGVAKPHGVPSWAGGAVVYQIFPERFRSGDPSLDPADSDPWGTEPNWLRFQGGDLVGIADKADYLAGLSVGVVYLNPVFTSPSTHKYDAIDYYSVDPAFGGNAALAELIARLHDLDMRLILDASFNHCHPRFFAFADLVERGADSPYHDWFGLTDDRPRIVVRPHMVGQSGWGDPEQYAKYLQRLEADTSIPVEYADDDGPVVELNYDAWYGVATMPRINLEHPDARRYFLEVAAHWLTVHNIDGWRMDVARYVDPDFWDDFRQVCKQAKPDCYLLAEVMGDAGPWLQGNRFDATMNYTFRQLCLDYFATRAIDTATFLDGYARMLAMYGEAATAVNQNLLGSHDTARFRHEAGDDRDRQVPAVLFQLTSPGSPGLYYGDEVGMTGGEEPGSRGPFPWLDEDGWDADLLEMVRALGRLRKEHPALRHGNFTYVWHGPDAFAFVRSYGSQRLLVVVNRGEALSDVEMRIPTSSAAHLWGSGRLAVAGHGVTVSTDAHGGLVARL